MSRFKDEKLIELLLFYFFVYVLQNVTNLWPSHFLKTLSVTGWSQEPASL
jgi:hypothetical protein